jgi:hypothetical protein
LRPSTSPAKEEEEEEKEMEISLGAGLWVLGMFLLFDHLVLP